MLYAFRLTCRFNMVQLSQLQLWIMVNAGFMHPNPTNITITVKKPKITIFLLLKEGLSKRTSSALLSTEVIIIFLVCNVHSPTPFRAHSKVRCAFIILFSDPRSRCCFTPPNSCKTWSRLPNHDQQPITSSSTAILSAS